MIEQNFIPPFVPNRGGNCALARLFEGGEGGRESDAGGASRLLIPDTETGNQKGRFSQC